MKRVLIIVVEDKPDGLTDLTWFYTSSRKDDDGSHGSNIVVRGGLDSVTGITPNELLSPSIFESSFHSGEAFPILGGSIMGVALSIERTEPGSVGQLVNQISTILSNGF